MDKNFFDKFNDIFGDNFGENFGKESTPEDFMGNSDYVKTEERDEHGNTTETYTSKDGKRKFTRTVVNAKTPQSYWEGLNNKTRPQGSRPDSDSKNNNQLYTLEEDLRRAVEQQEFEKAAKIRDEIAKIKKENSDKKSDVEIIIKCNTREDGTLEISKILQRGINIKTTMDGTKEGDRTKKQDIISDICKKVIEKYNGYKK